MENGKISKVIIDPIEINRERFEKEFTQKLVEIFPSVVKDGQIDYESLFIELGRNIETNEKYGLNWAGKTFAKKVSNENLIGKTLKYVPTESKDPSATGNLYIEGDNLEVIKLIRNSYYNKIKIIYIDPPYNTGNDFIYTDRFVEDKKLMEISEGERSDEGNRLTLNQKSSGRFHSNWLNMMYPRLQNARELLRDDGVLLLSIDENEMANVKKLLDEIFGEENYIGSFIWSAGRKNDSKFISLSHEYILCYFKNMDFSKGNELIWREKKEGLEEIYKAADRFVEESKHDYKLATKMLKKWYRELPDGHPSKDHKHYNCIDDRGVYFPADLSKPESNGARYEVLHPETGRAVKQPAGGWRYMKKETMDQLITENRIHFGEDESVIPCYKRYLNESEYQVPYSVFYQDNRSSSKRLQELMGGKVFDFPKDENILKRIFNSVSFANDNGINDDIILDFFSGSATTAHSVMMLNAEDGGNRKYIMVQYPELCDERSFAYKCGYKSICEIGKERIRRAGEKIKEEFKDKPGIENLDVGFKVFKVADTNIRWFSEAIKSDVFDYDMTMTDKDKLDFNPGFTDIDVVYEILLRHRDIPLSTNVEQLSNIGDRTYIFADTVVVCLEEIITDSMIDKIAAIEPIPTKIIFRDSAFGDDISLKENTMIRLEAQMRKHSGLEKRTYRVEFI